MKIDKATPHIALSVTDLAIGYTKKKTRSTVAKGIDFSLLQGELTGIVGINGIGKSTLLRTLGKVQPKLSGVIAIDGKVLENYSIVELASQISIVLTEPLTAKNLTVVELVALGRQPYTNWIGTLSDSDIQKIQSALDMVGIADLQNKKCYELSDGQLQKVMIARALAQDTPIMLLDEPTTHLDLYHKVSLLKLLQHIAHTTKKTILFTTHEIEVAIQLCDKILVLEREKSTFGPPNELISKQSFESLFPKDVLRFDSQTGAFKVIK